MIDAHVHIWGSGIARLSWLAGSGFPAEVGLDAVTTPESQLVSQVVIVTADAHDDQMLTEARAFSDLTTSSDDVYGFVGGIDLTGDVPAQLDRLTELPGLVGVRHNLQDLLATFEPDVLAAGWRALAERAVPFDACVRASELPLLTQLLRPVPELRVVLDHMGKPPVGHAEPMRRWADDLGRLAERSNTWCKLSGLPAECPGGRAMDAEARPIVSRALAEFGADRCLVGSDRPVSTDAEWCSRVLDWTPESARDAVGYDTAITVYRSIA